MKLNCKPDDLAIVVKAHVAENLGKIVKCRKLLPLAYFKVGGPTENAWLVDIDGKGPCPYARSLGYDACIPDANLRPIRDPGDGAQDEGGDGRIGVNLDDGRGGKQRFERHRILPQASATRSRSPVRTSIMTLKKPESRAVTKWKPSPTAVAGSTVPMTVIT